MAYHNRGSAYGYSREYQRAIDDFDQAIRLDPDYALAYNSRGNLYRNLGEYTFADADKAKACSLDSKYC